MDTDKWVLLLLRAERLRADLVVKSKIDYETAVQGANAVLYQNQRKADAELFKRQQEAEAVKRQAEADLFKRQQEAEAVFVARSREADAIVKQADAILCKYSSSSTSFFFFFFYGILWHIHERPFCLL